MLIGAEGKGIRATHEEDEWERAWGYLRAHTIPSYAFTTW